MSRVIRTGPALGWVLLLVAVVACHPPPAQTPPPARRLPCGSSTPSVEAARSLWDRALKVRRQSDEARGVRELLVCARWMLESATGTSAELEAFHSPEPIAWRGAFAYWSAVSAIGKERHLVQTRVDSQHLTLTPIMARPTALAATRALVTPEGRRLLVFGRDRLEVVEVATLRSKLVNGGASVAPNGQFVDAGRRFVSVTGGTACDSDSRFGLSVVDLDAARVRFLDPGDVSEISPSQQYAAVVANELATTEMRRILRIWNLRDLASAPVQVDLGAPAQTATAIQFDPAEQNVIVSDCGLAGAGRFDGPSTLASVDVRHGTLRGAPTEAANPPRDATERWEQLKATYSSLAHPHQLVATERGPGRFKSYAETTDRDVVALLAGDITVAPVQSVSGPTLLVVDGRSRTLKQRIPLPALGDRSFSGGIVEFAPLGTGLLVCLEAESVASMLVDVTSGRVGVIDTPRSDCDWSFSSDGAALLGAGAAWDVSVGRAYRVPFAATEEAIHETPWIESPSRNEPAPPWLLCRAGNVLAPYEVCVTGRLASVAE